MIIMNIGGFIRMNDFWHLLYLWAIFHFSKSQISHSKYWEKFESRDDLKPEIGPKDGTNIKFGRDQIGRNIASKWIGLNGKLSTSRTLTHPEVAEFIKKGSKRIVTDEPETETNAENRNADDFKLAHQLSNSSSESDLNSQSKIKFPLSETNYQKNSNKLAKRPIPLYIATHYFRLSKEIEKYLQENFNRELSNPKKERSISYESNDEEDQEYQSSDMTLSDSKFNQPNVSTTTNYNASLQAVPPTNYQSQLAETVEKNIETEQNSSSSFLLNATNKRNLNYEFQSQNSPLAIAEDGEKQKGILDTSILSKPGNCPPLNPLLHSLPHNDTDKSCGQTLTGSSVDPNCACMYFVAERNEEGCAAKFYILCYRPSDQHPEQIIEESFAPQVPNTHSEQYAETHSGEQQVDNYNQQSVNYNEQKLRRRSETINQTFPLDKEAELKKDEAQTTTINSTTKSASIKHQ